MKTLYFNPETKVIFASEDAQGASIEAITAIAVPDLIANGATVDASADSLMTSPEVGTASAGEQGTDAPANAPSADVSSTQATSQPLDSTVDAVPLAAGGTTVDVTQIGDQTVNTNVQNGNQLAGTTGNVLVNETPVVDAPVLDGDTATVTNVENDLNPLVPAAGTEGAPASQLAAQAAEPEAEPLPRESHLMLLEAKFAAALAKLRNAERVAADELEAIYVHVKAVL